MKKATIAAKLLYRIGNGVGLHTNLRTDTISFDRAAKEQMNHLVSLYEALEEVDFDIHQPIAERYRAFHRVNKKSSTERLLQKIDRLIALERDESKVVRKRETLRLLPADAPEEDFVEEHLQQLLTAISNE